MNRRQLATRVAEVLSENDVRKNIPAIKTVFHITDDQGGKSDFVIKKEAQGVRFTIDDLSVILDALIEVIIETITSGDKISITGFGSLYLKRRAARMAPHPVTGEMYKMKEHFVVKFDCGKRLRTAAAVFNAMNQEMMEKAENILAGKASYYDEDEDVIEDGRD